jgi:hypothetical protein
MKKILLIALLSPLSLIAQDASQISEVKYRSLEKNNIIKINLFSLVINNYNLTYERKIGKKFTASAGFRYMPKSTIPFKSTIENFIASPDVNINDVKIGNTAFTGELRWYAGKKAMRGFYIAPYFRYANFGASLPVENPSNDPANNLTYAPVIFDGKVTSFSGGLMFGVQYNLSKSLVIDFWILGAHVGKSNGVLTASNIQPGMDQATQDDLQLTLNDLQSAGPFSFDGKVLSANSAQIKSSGPWAGIRAFALSLGYRF